MPSFFSTNLQLRFFKPVQPVVAPTFALHSSAETMFLLF
jgi:hypothetical protein